jgi:hypothetical protein
MRTDDNLKDGRRFAPATLRNREPILAVLRAVLPATGTVLEVASGSGEHVAFFAEALPALSFQPSDPDPANRVSIAAWTAALGLQNVCDPLDLDAAAAAALWPVERVDAVYCVNMIHIAPWAAAVGLFAGAAAVLPPAAPLMLYGPFKRDGAHTAPSNADFDAALRAENPEWGVRDLEAVVDRATWAGFVLDRLVAMPANNLSVVFRRV